DAVGWLRRLGVRHLRTGLSWADWLRPNAEAWFDRQMRAIEEFEVTLTLCYTPDREGLEPNCTSPPRAPERFAAFAAWVAERYAGARQAQSRSGRPRGEEVPCPSGC
ncbi:MAG TPA: hypothetical protein VIC32_07895, partial [Terriglobales bacterium]